MSHGPPTLVGSRALPHLAASGSELCGRNPRAYAESAGAAASNDSAGIQQDGNAVARGDAARVDSRFARGVARAHCGMAPPSSSRRTGAQEVRQNPRLQAMNELVRIEGATMSSSDPNYKSPRPPGSREEDAWLSDEQLARCVPAETEPFQSHVPTRMVTNGEHMPRHCTV